MTTIVLNGVTYVSEDEVESRIARAVDDAMECYDKTDELWVKVYKDKVTAFRSKEEADQHKSYPRADRRFVLDISYVEPAHDWQRFGVVEDE